MKYLLGYDLGSSSVKVALLEAATGRCLAARTAPAATEMPMAAPRPGWAEQDPACWWHEVQQATRQLHAAYRFEATEVGGIGLTYQMHGLVLLDQRGAVLRPAIIWCDSRAVTLGEQARQALGEAYCQQHLLNSPGNFTASKLAWVRQHEPALYARAHRALLPGDYLAYCLTGELATTVPGLSEGIFWDFQRRAVAAELLAYYGLDAALLPPLVPTFGEQGRLTVAAAAALGLAAGTPVAYRAGDQPNNAFALRVLHPGEVAATAGTSGVVYGVSEQPVADPAGRVNSFVHVTSTAAQPRTGVLLCVNGTGSLNSWLRRLTGGQPYAQLNALAAEVPVGAGGLRILPFGNGAERMLGSRPGAASLHGLQFNRHDQRHVLRAGQEGVAFALAHGLGLLRQLGVPARQVRAGHANMFLSPVFREAFVNTAGLSLDLYNTDAAQGAARGAGIGIGYYAGPAEAFGHFERLLTLEPEPHLQAQYQAAFGEWEELLVNV